MHPRLCPRTRLIWTAALAAVLFASGALAQEPRPAPETFQLEPVKNPDPNAALLDFGHHVRVRLGQEGAATEVVLPVRLDLLRAADLGSLRLARYDAERKRYVEAVPLTWDGKVARATISRSGDYSVMGLPADPSGRIALGPLCAIEGRATPKVLDPICKVILCAAFKEIGDPGAFRGLPPGGGPPPGGDVCERCTGLGGSVTANLGECLLTPPVVLDPPVIAPLLPVCTTRPSLIADPSAPGSYPVASTDYKFVDAINIPPGDPNTDVWATVRYPGTAAGANAPVAAGAFPLVVYLHGNHGIWVSGGNHVCSPATATPVPNHEGYNYVLDRLASLGFIAVSINANDLNCKADRIVERGKLILEHLRRWKDWNDPTKPDATFKGRFYEHVDMNRIGLAGHSRGGEAVISAYLENQASKLGYGIKAIHSIAPVDFKGFTLVDVPYSVILPAADGDVSTLHGLRIYDRAAPRTDPARMPKMQSHVYGANHNWFNTVWFQDEGSGPNRLTDANQRAVERVLGVAFFRQFLQSYGTARGLFTGTATVGPAVMSAEVYRSYQDPVHKSVDDFEDAPANALANSLGGANANVSLAPFNEFPFTQGGGSFNTSFFHETRGLVAGWNAATDTFTLNVPAAHKNVSTYGYLAFRVAQVFDNGATNPLGAVQDLDVGLEDELGNKIFFRVGSQDVIQFPYQRPSLVKTVLQTVRVGLTCYSCSSLVGVDRTAIARIHFRFNRKPAGLVGLDSIQFSR
jgi:dienelactone hydrolase